MSATANGRPAVWSNPGRANAMTPMQAAWWFFLCVVQLNSVAVSIQALGRLSFANTWQAREFLALIAVPGVFFAGLWCVVAIRAAYRFHRRARG